MDVVVNGKARTVCEGTSVRDLVEAAGLRTRNVVVERNGEPIERARFATVLVADGDVLEIVRPVPGG